MQRIVSVGMAAVVVGLFTVVVLVTPVSAQAAFGLEDYEMALSDNVGEPESQAGAHPFVMRTSFDVETEEKGIEFESGFFEQGTFAVEAVEDLMVELAEGFVDYLFLR